ncbi:MAG: PorP/SprF family type IX secretion system membrane protein, partial [Bacteroidia bacterium]|nr:PorP/SprF family type IX secretion system membrane protein [Bacteroidia bacterium]
MKALVRLMGVAFLVWNTTLAQQDPQFSMYMFNRQILNPAATAANGMINFTLAGRSQWVGIDGHPNTVTLTAGLPVKMLGGAIGASIMGDEIGPISTMSAKLAYAFNLPIGENGTALRFGLDAGFFQKSLDGATFRPGTPGDNSLLLQNISLARPDIGVGVYFHLPNDKFYIGVNANHLTEPDLKNFTQSGNSKISRSFNIMAGYKFDLVKEKVSLQPSIFAKNVASQFQVDLNANLYVSPM